MQGHRDGRLMYRSRVLVLITIGLALNLSVLADDPPATPASKPATTPPSKPEATPPSKPAATFPTASRSPDLEVVSRAKKGEQVSEFLRSRPDRPYGLPDEEAMRNAPAQEAKFFGVKGRGKFYVYVVDCSGSMAEEFRLERAKQELRASIFGLRDTQRFHVIFYNHFALPMPGPVPKSPDLPTKVYLNNWLDLIIPDGGTDPRGAFGQALALSPDAIFLLSDGVFPGGTVEDIFQGNPGRIPIHCIDLTGGQGGDQLQRIATFSGGQYVFRQ